jgi:bacillithiol system protein YtxJ
MQIWRERRKARQCTFEKWEDAYSRDGIFRLLHERETRRANGMGRAKGSVKETNAHFVPVSNQEDLDRLLAASAEQPVVLFKHDFACSISVRAYWNIAAVPGEVALIDVERQRALSQAVAARLGVKHESPQVIVVRDGQPVYAASHWEISWEAVTRAADRAEASAGNQGDASPN